MYIEDGTGKGYKAKVDSRNLLECNAIEEPTYGYMSRVAKRAFVVTSAAITTDGTANNVFILKNPSDTRNVVVVQLDISCTTTQTIVVNLDQTYTSGGTGVTPTNLNRASAILSAVTNTDCYYGDDMTLGGTAIIYSQFVNLATVPFREEFYNALILGEGDALSVSLNAATGTAYVSVKYYEVAIE